MNPLERIARLYDIHLAIKQERTGSPIEFAKKFHISRSHFYNIKEELENYGAVITYSRKHGTFCYENDFEITETTFWKKEIQDFFKKKLSVQGKWTEEM